MLVEDDTVDVMTVKRALKDISVTNHLIVASDGEEALSYLTDDRNKRPGIILLDLNMPGMTGIEFLAVAKKWGTEEYPGRRVDDIKRGSGQGGPFQSQRCRIHGQTGRLCPVCGSDEEY
jgi:CheY-like chemotaxis protein